MRLQLRPASLPRNRHRHRQIQLPRKSQKKTRRKNSARLVVLSANYIREQATPGAPRISASVDGLFHFKPEWATLISGAPAPPFVRAATFLRPFDSDTKPVEVLCDDGMAYVVKALWADVNHRPKNARIKEPRNDAEQGRRMFNEQVCGRLGMMMNAPVPSITLVNLPQPLIEANPEGMGHLKPCNAHGSMTIPNVSGAVGGFDHADKGDNRERYCRLAVLFGWLVHGDMQFLPKTLGLDVPPGLSARADDVIE